IETSIHAATRADPTATERFPPITPHPIIATFSPLILSIGNSFLSPVPSSILWDNSPQRINFAVSQFLDPIFQRLPWIPQGTEELSGNSIAFGRRKEDRKFRTFA